MKKYGVIMAGGGGTRFWPLSRQKTPKQLLNLTGKNVIVNESIDRLSYTVDNQNIFIVTTAEQAQQMLDVTTGRILPEHILIEPCARNTAACIGYAAMEILKKHGDGIMIITPSDAYIQDSAAFTRTLAEAIHAAEETNKLVTIGITPTFPATGYGYIRFYNTNASAAKTVTHFKEKPDVQTASAYLASGEYVWNSGIFVWRASTILNKFEKYIPDIYADLKRIGAALSTDAERSTIESVYPSIRRISVDYAVMEPAAGDGDVLVIPGEFGWNDVGSWDMISVMHEPDDQGNIQLGDTLAIHTRNSILYSSSRLVSAVGANDMIIVETADAVLVCAKDSAQDVKLIVEALQAQERNNLL